MFFQIVFGGGSLPIAYTRMPINERTPWMGTFGFGLNLRFVAECIRFVVVDIDLTLL